MKTDVLEQLGGNGYVIPEGFVIVNEERETGSVTNVVMAIRNRETSALFGVKFNEIVGLAFAGNTMTFPNLSDFLIEDVSGDGWEGVRYSVYDRDFVSFRCRSIDFLSANTLESFMLFLKLVKCESGL
jgi:hypothetical protein